MNTEVRPQRCPGCHGIWLDARELKRFLKLARISQEIHPHVVGLVNALEEEAKERAKWDRIGALGDGLNAEVRRPYGSWNLWRFFLDWWR